MPSLGEIVEPLLPDEPLVTTTITITVPLVDEVIEDTTEGVGRAVGALTDP